MSFLEWQPCHDSMVAFLDTLIKNEQSLLLWMDPAQSLLTYQCNLSITAEAEAEAEA